MQRDQYAVVATARTGGARTCPSCYGKGSIQRYDLVVLTVLIGEIVLYSWVEGEIGLRRLTRLVYGVPGG